MDLVPLLKSVKALVFESIFARDIEFLYNEAIEVYFKAGVHPLGSSYDGKPVISCCGLTELEILVPKVAQSKVEPSKSLNTV